MTPMKNSLFSLFLWIQFPLLSLPLSDLSERLSTPGLYQASRWQEQFLFWRILVAANQEHPSRHQGGAGYVGIAPDLHAPFANCNVVVSEHSGNSSANYSVLVLESFYQNCFEFDNWNIKICTMRTFIRGVNKTSLGIVTPMGV